MVLTLTAKQRQHNQGTKKTYKGFIHMPLHSNMPTNKHKIKSKTLAKKTCHVDSIPVGPVWTNVGLIVLGTKLRLKGFEHIVSTFTKG